MDLARCGCRPILGAVQGEANTRVLEVDLYNNGIAWTIPSTAVVDVAYQKPDGTKGIYNKLPDGTKATTFSGNVLSATIAPQMVTCAGTIRAAFVFSNGGDETLATFPFTITVEANPAAGAEISEDYFNPKDLSDIQAAVALALLKTGGKMEGNIDMNGNRIAGLPEPATRSEPLTQNFMNQSMGQLYFNNNTTFDIRMFNGRGVILVALGAGGSKGNCLWYIGYDGTTLTKAQLAGTFAPTFEVVDKDGLPYLRVGCTTNWSYGFYIATPANRGW
jgi:hypothetical protein